jgi:fucose permease
VDAALNQFVAAHYSSRHMNWLHGFWGIGASTGPLVMGAALAGSGGWHLGVQAIGLAQLGLAVLLWLSLRLWAQAPQPLAGADAHEGVQAHAVHPLAWWLAPLCFLVYVAAEMGTGLWAASVLVNERAMPPPDAGIWVGLYFGSITAGRFGVGLIADRLGNRKLVRLGIALALSGALVFALPMVFGALSPWGLMVMGLGCAPIFPSMMHETTRRFPAEAATRLIGRQMACAYVGGSVIPAAFGLLATWAGLGAVMPAVVGLLLCMLLMTSVLDRIS